MKLISSWISLNIYCILIVRECNKYKPIYTTFSLHSIYTQYIPTTRSSALFSLTHFPRIQFENTQLNRLIFNNFSALCLRHFQRSLPDLERDPLIWFDFPFRFWQFCCWTHLVPRAEAAPPTCGPFKELPIGWQFNFYLPPSRGIVERELGREREEGWLLTALSAVVGCHWQMRRHGQRQRQSAAGRCGAGDSQLIAAVRFLQTHLANCVTTLRQLAGWAGEGKYKGLGRRVGCWVI